MPHLREDFRQKKDKAKERAMAPQSAIGRLTLTPENMMSSNKALYCATFALHGDDSWYIVCKNTDTGAGYCFVDSEKATEPMLYRFPADEIPEIIASLRNLRTFTLVPTPETSA